MKTPSHESNTVHMPPELLAEARKVASEEHRAPDELVSDAVRRYLQERRQQAAMSSRTPSNPHKNKASELFSALGGVDIDLSRNPSRGRPVTL
jgi:hypothetical protein